MGYMDLSVLGSDKAAGFADDCGKALAKLLNKEIPRKANEFNTNGLINAAMFFEEVICRSEIFDYNDELKSTAAKIIAGLDDTIRESEKGDWDEKDYHLRRYREMRRRIKAWKEK